MKTRKFIVAIIIGAILVPSASFAQTTQTRDQLTQQLIQLLLQQIQVLQAQLASLQEKSLNESDEVKEASVANKAEEKIVEQKSIDKENQKKLKQQEVIIKQLKAIDDECSPSGCDYGLRYQQEWNRLIDELKDVGGTYDGSCLFDLVGNRNAISPGSKHLTWRCIGWGG
jgi:type II secretory pathway pseudopilin PulG